VDAAIADVLDHPLSRPALANLAGEAIRVAGAEGVRCEGFDGFEPAAFAFAGVWRDLAVRRRKTEVDQIVGAVVAAAGRREIAVPLLARLQEMIRDLEEGRRTMRWDNLEELCALSARVYGR